jgi:hypothetical protein
VECGVIGDKMAKKLKIYNGASWEDVTFAITPPNTAVTNAFTTNQVIETSTSVAALRITQNGSGEALRVEDETNPDSSPFVINSAGNVGIGRSVPTVKLDILGPSGGTALRLTDDVNSTLLIKTESPGNLLTYEVVGAASQRFVTAGVERMRITNTGNIGFGVASPTFKIQTYNDLSSATVGTQALVFQAQVANGNNDYLKLYQERTVAATPSWGGTDWILRRHVDASPMGGFRWAAGDWNPRAIYGTPTTPAIRTTHISTGSPSGGIDGDMWATYV